MKIKMLSCVVNQRALVFVALLLAGVANVRADYTNTVLNDTPLAYYPLGVGYDSGTVATDLSGNNNNGTYNNTFPGFNDVPGPSPFITNGINFDGGFSFVDLGTGGNPTLLNFGGPITMEAWAQPSNPSQNLGDILAKGYDSANGDDEIALRLNGSRYEGVTFSDARGTQGAVGGNPTNLWQYVVATFDGANWNMYVNGIQVGQSGDTVGAINFATPWHIGSGSASGANRFFAGNLSHVALYSHALTSAQVITHYVMGNYGINANTSVPIITTQPQSQSNFPGNSVTFSVSALSTLPMTNQWFKNNSPILGKTNSTLVVTNIQVGDATSYRVVVGNSNGTTNSASATLTLLASGNSLQWSSADVGNNGSWDTGGSVSWINLANSQQTVFNTTDQVLFDDTVNAPTTVAVNGDVAPSVFTINSTNNNYSLTGSGRITGAGSMVKKGPSSLILNVPGNFTGSATISGGTVLTAGQNTLGSASSIIITNGGTLDLDGQTMHQTLSIAGTGVGGAGAIINSGNDIYDAVLNVTLNTDSVFGGNGRWDLASGSTISGPHKLTLARANSGNYGEWNGVSIATNVGDIELAVGKLGVKSMDTLFGDTNRFLIVDNGFELDFWTGGCNRNIHVLPNGLFQLLTSLSAFNANVTLEDTARFVAIFGSGNLPMNGQYTLNGVVHLQVGDANLVFNNVVSGTGGFVWDAYNHQVVFNAVNTYTGPTIMTQGLAVALKGNGSMSQSTNIFFGGTDSTSVHVDATGRTDLTLTLASGQTLGGIGAVAGNLTVSPGATIAPAGTNTTIGITAGANPTGAISASANVSLGGTTVLKLNGNGTNDMVQAGGSITYGGTLNLLNISGTPLAAGNSFHIFSAASYSGSFTGGIVPATPGPGLVWDKTQLSAGTINVITGTSQPVSSSSSVSGSNFIFSGTNGPAGSNYVVLVSTNIATPLTNWTPVLTNTFDINGAFHVTNAINPAAGRGFYLLKVQ